MTVDLATPPVPARELARREIVDGLLDRLRDQEAWATVLEDSLFSFGHDLWNLLSSVDGYAQLASGEHDPDALRAYVDDLHRGIERASALTQSAILIFRPHGQPGDVIDLRSTIAALEPELRACWSGDLETSMPGDPAFVGLDGDAAETLVRSLFGAVASVATEGAPIRLTVRLPEPVLPGRPVMKARRVRSLVEAPSTAETLHEWVMPLADSPWRPLVGQAGGLVSGRVHGGRAELSCWLPLAEIDPPAVAVARGSDRL